MVRARAAEAIAKLGQKRSDWTDDRLLELSQDNLSDWRQTAGLVLANREILAFRTYDKVMALRNDPRPWVRFAAWDALLEIEKVREARKREARQTQPPESAK
jgi:HEAT repeat protein